MVCWRCGLVVWACGGECAMCVYALVRMAGPVCVHVCASPLCMSLAHALLWRRTTRGTVGRASWTLVVDCCLCGVCVC